MASWYCHCSLEAGIALAALAFLIPVAQMTSTLLVEAKPTASYIAAVYWAFTFLIASEVSISFWQWPTSVSDMTHWGHVSIVALAESRWTIASFLSSWRHNTSSDRLTELAGNGKGVGLVSLSRVQCEREWLEWAVMSAVSTCEDPWWDGGSCFR